MPCSANQIDETLPFMPGHRVAEGVRPAVVIEAHLDRIRIVPAGLFETQVADFCEVIVDKDVQWAELWDVNEPAVLEPSRSTAAKIAKKIPRTMDAGRVLRAGSASATAPGPLSSDRRTRMLAGRPLRGTPGISFREALVLPQRRQRLNFRRPARRQIRREAGDHCQQRQHHRIRRLVCRCHAEQESTERW